MGKQFFRPNLKRGMCYIEDVYHVPCGHWADRPRMFHRCPAAPDQPLDQLQTIPSLSWFEQRAGLYREHGDPKKPKPGMRMSRPCTNAVSCGSAQDVMNKCPRCMQTREMDRAVSEHRGMWFSFYRDPTTGKAVLKDRNAESAASRRARGVVDREDGGSTPTPQGTRKKPPQVASIWEPEDDDEAEFSYRHGSWSSHGHVEL